MTLMGEVETLRHELQQTRARLEQVEPAADQDQLLPMLNRRAFVRELTPAYRASRRATARRRAFSISISTASSGSTTPMAMPAGDAVLVAFRGDAARHVRDSDVVGRLGGDEFGIILAHADEAQAHEEGDALVETR